MTQVHRFLRWNRRASVKRIYENPKNKRKPDIAKKLLYSRRNFCVSTAERNMGFLYFPRDFDVPEKIEQWDSIEVPSCWQLQGYENPNDTNVNYPCPVDPPYVPDDNPCGVYQRRIRF